jgi:fatty-acyl-CoA synthase
MTDWNFAHVYRTIAASAPDRVAVVQGDRTVPWAELDRRAGALAADLLTAGVSEQGKVAAFLFNGPEYLETYAAAFAAGLVPFNCNYRYGPDELRHVLANGDAEAVVLHASLVPVADAVRDELPSVRRWYVVPEDGAPGLPAWASDYDAVVAGGRPGSVPRDRTVLNRGGDDELILYTGGTTGYPKGVVWRQDDLYTVLGRGGHRLLDVPPLDDLDALRARLARVDPGPVMLIACPLTHGTGQFTALSILGLGGTVVLLANRRFDVEELWSAAADHRANGIVIVGQVFAQPMLEHLQAHPDRYDLSALRLISSSGVMWSQENKDGLLALLPDVALLDNYGSSEAVGAGGSVSRAGAKRPSRRKTAEFRLGPDSAVFTEDGRRVEPGSGERGLVAVSGPIPLGYYKDEAKTAATFREFEGRRWSVPGDWAEVHADGRVKLLGRGSSCINTGGEKVFPEEVEEVLKEHPLVLDAVVVGVPDARFGEAVCALVESSAGEDAVAAADLPALVRGRLAGFKAPRHVFVIDSMGRAPNGKVDYRRLKARAAELSEAGA